MKGKKMGKILKKKHSTSFKKGTFLDLFLICNISIEQSLVSPKRLQILQQVLRSNSKM